MTTNKNQIEMTLKGAQIRIEIIATSEDRARKFYQAIEGALVACNDPEMQWSYTAGNQGMEGDRKMTPDELAAACAEWESEPDMCTDFDMFAERMEGES